MAKISPENSDYILERAKNIFSNKEGVVGKSISIEDIYTVPDKSLSPEDLKRKHAKQFLDSLSTVAPGFQKQVGKQPDLDILKQQIHTGYYQRKLDTGATQALLLRAAMDSSIGVAEIIQDKRHPWSRMVGKIAAYHQTVEFFKNDPVRIITGAGMGNFSSKLAFRATGLHIAGSYPEKFKYIHQDFRDNHLALFLFYFSKDAELHSVANSPNSVYDQIFSEYGIIGILAFLYCYLWYFLAGVRKATYGIFIFVVLLVSFFFEYWFEQLSVVVLGELFLLLNIKETKGIWARKEGLIQ
jgi:hypothetical protein